MARHISYSSRKNQRPRTTAGGDGQGNAMGATMSWDEELDSVESKEYEKGELGALEAMDDMNSVLHEVAQDPMAQKLDKLIPRFLAPPKSAETHNYGGKQAHLSRSKTTPRHAKLTARPRTVGGKSGPAYTEERASVPNIPQQESIPYDNIRHIRSAPTIGHPKHSTHTSFKDIAEPFATFSSADANLSSQSIVLDNETTEDDAKLSLTPSSVRQDINSSLTTSETKMNKSSCDDDIPRDTMRMDFSPENLLEVASDTEETDEAWKADVVELTRIKSTPKGKSYNSPESLELKYKDPIWPHQLFLHQILARQAFLTHLVLDGSELRFLRDLGSSLQSLITLSICDCGLRSLDGVFGIPNLRTLIARKNKIQIPTQLAFLRKLCYVDLSSNPITSSDVFGSLKHCGELRILKVYDTPLAKVHPDFNKEIKRLVPQLKEIHPTLLFDLAGVPNLIGRGRSEETATDRNVSPSDDYVKGKLGQNLQQSQEKRTMGREKIDKKEFAQRHGHPSKMPSFSYNEMMRDQPTPGIAYQKIKTKTLQQQKDEHYQKEKELRDANNGNGDFGGLFMAPKFLKHLEEAMILSSGNEDEGINAHEGNTTANETGTRHEVESSPEKVLDVRYSTDLSIGELEVRDKKADSELLYDGKRQKDKTSNYHPMGDGDHLN